MLLPHETDEPVSRESLAHAELRKYDIQELLNINPACYASEGRGCGTQAFGSQIQLSVVECFYKET
jgi:hypothetical protein